MIVTAILLGASAAGLVWCYVFLKHRELRGIVEGDIPIPNELFRFLERADDGYMRTHETKQISYFSPYASSAVCHELLERIRNDPPTLFGTPALRTRTWRVKEAGDGYYLIRKRIAHRTLPAGSGIRIALGDGVDERWRVAVLPGGYRIEEVN